MQALLTRRSLLGAGAALAAQAATEPLRLPRKVRVGLIGLDGHIGEILTPLKSLPDVEVVAIADPDGRARERLAPYPSMPKARRYTDYRNLLDREKLDIAAVCGQNGTRASQIIDCADHKLHVVAEKPLAIERADLERVKQAVRRNSVRLTMLLPMRFWGIYRAMKQIVDSGAVGEVAQISAQKSYKLGERPDWMRHRSTFGSTIPYIGVHMIDLMRFASRREMVETASFQARVGYPKLQDMQNTTGSLFRMDNGGVATLHMDFLRPETASTHGDDRLRLAGTHGVVEYQEATGLTLVTDREKPRTITDVPPNRFLFVDFLDSVYNGKLPGLSLADIYRVSDIVLAAQDAASQQRVIRI